MSTQYSKGQGADAIGVVLLFAIGLLVALFFLVLQGHAGASFEESTSTKVEYSIGEIRTRSALTMVMVDKIWRADEVPFSRYGDKSAYKLVSYYFSTDGDTVRVSGGEFQKSELKQDIKDYLEMKMDKIFVNGPNQVSYAIEISDEQKEIVVKSDDYNPSGKWSKISYPLALTNGETANVVMWTKTSQGIFSVG